MGVDLRIAIEGAYAAALDESLWAEWTWQTAHMLGGVCGTFYVVEAPGRIRLQHIRHENSGLVERYISENIMRFDPQISYAASRRSPHIYADTDHADRDDPATREYFAWQASNGKMQHYLTAAAPLDGGRIYAGLSLHRHVDDGPTPDEMRRRLEKLLPDIHRALDLGFLHAEKMASAYWDGLLSRRTEPCLLLDEQGKVLRTTPEMEALLVRGDGLRCVRRRLTCGGGIADAALDRFVGLLTGGSGVPGLCRIDRPSGKAAYILNGYPLPGRARIMAPMEAVAMVTLIDPAAVPPSSAHRWQLAYGLTPREREMAELMVAGQSLDDAATILAISKATARVHLRQIFAKTDTNRQAEMIQLLSRIGA
ncbi:DNA-binding CsgD family transcriptional regulator [Sphingomonas sp. SORGH_AS870]|uniref:helix-turn-helix transcriptional regulator n=1 Tax=Sphingomonas sp. SORGH_AS_0870 TaxID=3041801 RepID=UPI00285EFC89|nr:helix-turn-helix transcriptional regulator [Sphingomonas sp. SORGH_AS_0870]MDR6147401.1 DNA-binding CsgD family transcriptional regulator [Sphingomonas sp. SORGH_AS_0870]